MKKLTLLLAAISLTINCLAQKITQTGELKKWHKITFDFEGPATSELAQPNPFTYYRMDVTFTHESGAPILVVPAYYAADGNAANTSAAQGSIWRVHFAPEKTGQWQYEVAFKAGENAAITEGGVSAGFCDGKKGRFTVENSDKKLPDNRAKGRLCYVGKRYLQWAETGDYFLKTGADSPENMLHYADFDGTLDGYGKLGKDYLQLMKTWQPHAQDYEPSADAFLWQSGKGKNIMGAVNYLFSKGQNAFSFLTFSVDGDDGCVYPHLVKADSTFISTSKESKSWEKALHHDRFDCSKLDQWEKVFEYADTKGLFLHFKTFENESASTMGKSDLTLERKLYYRELIARFGHHLALNWNLSEETNVDVNLVRKTAAFVRQLDPYKHHLVQHTFPPSFNNNKEKNKNERPNFNYYYYNLVGFQSELTGASLQLDVDHVHQQVKQWVENSEKTGKNWVVCNDEQGNAGTGVTVDKDYPTYVGKKPDNTDLVRHEVLWGTFLAGGAGVEYYYGYQTEANDLNAQDHRTRAKKYEQAKIARDFLQNLPFHQMHNQNDLTAATDDFVFAKEGEVYVVYLPKGGTTNINLPTGKWQVQWFNPRSGGALSASTALKGSLTAPDAVNDWVALIKK
jgi:Domain of unknown function (DUF5060)/Putative collagen-binding domain of a collagenase